MASKEKTYVAYTNYNDNSILVVAEAGSMKELMQMIENGEAMTTDVDQIKIGYYEK